MADRKPSYEELVKRIEALQTTVESLMVASGFAAPKRFLTLEERPDYVPHGSAEHAIFLGLVPVNGDETRNEDWTYYTSPRTNKTYRLENELGAVEHYPALDPGKAARLVLMQKVNELEIAPTIPSDAPTMFQPGFVD